MKKLLLIGAALWFGLGLLNLLMRLKAGKTQSAVNTILVGPIGFA